MSNKGKKKHFFFKTSDTFEIDIFPILSLSEQ